MSARGKILDTIGALQNSLTKTEKKIATAILSQPDLLNQCSLSKVANQLDVGEATFIRFCRTLGFKGYTDFKLDLAIELATQQKESSTLLDTYVAETDTPKEIAIKLQNTLNNVIAETVNLLDYAELEKVVEELRKADRIFLFGVGSSGLTAEDAQHKLMRIGLHAAAVTNNHFMYMQAALLKKGDIVIGISHSGYSEETTKALKISRDNGAKTVAITHNLRSPITKEADYVLINGNRQGHMQGDSIGTKMTQLFVLDLIYALLVKAEPEKAIQQKQKTLSVILDQRLK
ncbi:MurR/RpiR family transcriptional regulator [Glaesserella parasuis]|uniref:Putative HTH-type transcriptional regulator n=1 Tax=Glaesserella parasuis serovar 5 (strain SH0165) TaxID=557723 RepID=B8F435_GLAP5|nr:MurR/RpiR family transcriptional regulator [Glaesserella parasuis]ACL32087.1 putative HTH-type transcriptional regulator [Glaesserella parasuis SH0165]KDD80992.1 N-acetylmannosamine kinase [Glaesserella parasuis ST4-1]MCT8555349.1 MurR/RpiR family transcriptional regulator [Glaesserella parasuis]MCT8704404.1 MurR/RpiR family transcriptional regulator [Glaesserella parasuis]MCT8705754.1 MurR/RpiR family transcriptional regulator [Glaesserella parasuis]